MKRPSPRQVVKPESATARDVAGALKSPFAKRLAELVRAAPHRSWVLALLLVSATIIAYSPVWHAGFVWDDRTFVVDNPLIHRADGLYRFWFTTQPEDYYPVTSTMWWLEWRVWGANPVGYHVVNVLLHSFSAVILWRMLERLNVPGAWLAAALFALHPVNVESVAWIAQRKNTLAMFFYLLSLWSYLRFDPAGHPAPVFTGPASGGRPSTVSRPSRWYWISLIAFLLALLSKTAVAPMPLVLLGLAWWRRGTVNRRDLRQAVPFFAASVAVGLVSLWFQSYRAIGPEAVRTDSFWARLAGAGWAVWFYLYKAALPFGLSSIYPRWEIDGGRGWSYAPGLLVVGGLLACWRARRRWGRAPLAAFGYFVVMLLPVLGFLDIGFMWVSLVADHWQYFAIIGPISFAAAATTMAGRKPGMKSRLPVAIPVGALLVVLGASTSKQCRKYLSPETFWKATLEANSGSWSAHNGLGNVLFERGQADEAIAHFQKAVELKPDFSTAHYNLAGVLREKGRVDDAMAQFERAVEIQPDYSSAHFYLGEILRDKGRVQEAIAHFEKALEHHPDYAAAHESLGLLLLRTGQVDRALVHFRKLVEIQPGDAVDQNNLARVLWQKGRVGEAIAHYERALQIRPDYALAHQSLGGLLEQEGRAREAVAHYQRALEIEPSFATAWSSMAWVLATSPDASVRNGGRAVVLAEEAQRVSGGSNPVFVATLAAAYAEAGRFREASQTATSALQLATAQQRTELANLLRSQISLYQMGAAYRDTGRVAK
jgi:tetratricopeptide (TPR) repeat protein